MTNAPRRPRTIATAAILAAVVLTVAACGADDEGGSDPLGSPALPSPDGSSATLSPGQAIWVAVLAEGPDEGGLGTDLEGARAAVGDYLAERIVIREVSCYEGLDDAVEGPYVVAVQDTAEHGVHAMYLEVTDDPLFYGPVTLAC
jgi:hypothetical protein